MKKIIAVLAISLLTISSCKKEVIEVIDAKEDTLSFLGTWSRTYDILGSDFVATYIVDSNKISYSNIGDGPGNADYELILDSYDKVDKRWIGHTSNNKYYLIFIKDETEENITLYKQKISDPNEAENIAIPAADIEENYGWNTYKKQ